MERIKRTILAGVALLTLSPLCHGDQVYYLYVVMDGPGNGGSITFSASFDFNPAGTSYCLQGYCPSGVVPAFSNLSFPPPPTGYEGDTAFTTMSGSPYSSSMGLGSLSFTAHLPDLPSDTHTFGFDFQAPLGGATIPLTDITYTIDYNSTGTWSCGGPDETTTLGTTCPVAILSTAPVPLPGAAFLLFSGLGVLGLAACKPRVNRAYRTSPSETQRAFKS